MVRIRSDIASIRPYVPGRRIDEIARDIGLDPAQIVKLASNESPWGPFVGVAEAVAGVVETANRYPDNDLYDLRERLSSILGVGPDHLWFGAGTTGLLGDLAAVVGGAGTSAVYGWPGFVMYRIISTWSGSRPVEVPLDGEQRLDLGAMLPAIAEDTTVVYVCNPNNPTGTIVTSDALTGFIAEVPERVLIVVDEAYHDFVDDPAYGSALDHALARPNVVVMRTFSKIYALASLRVGYAVAQPELIAEMRKAQAPFAVSQVAQAAALASLGQDDELQRRKVMNASGRHYLHGALSERDVPHTVSQANFVFCHPGDDSERASELFTERGVIVRPISGGWLRVTVGDDEANRRFVDALDALREVL